MDGNVLSISNMKLNRSRVRVVLYSTDMATVNCSNSNSLVNLSLFPFLLPLNDMFSVHKYGLEIAAQVHQRN